MQMTLRWYGSKHDSVTLEQIRQIPGVKSVITTLYDSVPGEAWSLEDIRAMKKEVEAAGLTIAGIESVNIHDAIKIGSPDREQYIENYITTLERLGQEDIHMVCYNFMPVFDWTRSQLDKELEDGSTALVYYKDQVDKLDPLNSELSLPGWDSSYTKEEMADLFAKYKALGEEGLWENLKYFLEQIIPVAELNDIKMAIHPDDPPWPIFGLPRIITKEENLDRFLKLVDSKYNGLTLCTGSLGCANFNDMPKLVDKYSAMGRIHFMHVRNVKLLNDGVSFEESAHYSGCGSLDIVEIMRVLHKNGFDGYLRPDHGRMIWGETGKPGYGLYDRALGASYITGIWETLTKLGK